MNKLICAICTGVLSLTAIAEDKSVYRWTDSAGNVHYTQIPPQGQRYEEVNPRGARKTAGKDTTRDSGLSGDVDAFLEQVEAKKKAEEKAENEARQKMEVAQKNCTTAREHERLLVERGGHRLATRDADGNVERMSNVEFQKRLTEIRGKVQEYCQ